MARSFFIKSFGLILIRLYDILLLRKGVDLIILRELILLLLS